MKHLLPGDVIFADRGFNIGETLAVMGATLDIPAFTRGRTQLSPSEVETTSKFANVHIHVERAIGTVNQRFEILSATGVLSRSSRR